MIITVSITDKHLEEINEFCNNNGYKRSTVFLKGALMFINKSLLKDENGNLWESKIGASPIKTKEDVKKVINKRFSDVKKEGYHFVSYLGKYVKDND